MDQSGQEEEEAKKQDVRTVAIVDVDQTLVPQSMFVNFNRKQDRNPQEPSHSPVLLSLVSVLDDVFLTDQGGSDLEYLLGWLFHMARPLHPVMAYAYRAASFLNPSNINLSRMYRGVEEFLSKTDPQKVYLLTVSPHYLGGAVASALESVFPNADVRVVANDYRLEFLEKIKKKIRRKEDGEESQKMPKITRYTKPKIAAGLIIHEAKELGNGRLVVYVMGNKPADIAVVEELKKYSTYEGFSGTVNTGGGDLRAHRYVYTNQETNASVEIYLVPVAVNPNPRYLGEENGYQTYGGISVSKTITHLPDWAYKWPWKILVGIPLVYYPLAMLSGGSNESGAEGRLHNFFQKAYSMFSRTNN